MLDGRVVMLLLGLWLVWVRLMLAVEPLAVVRRACGLRAHGGLVRGIRPSGRRRVALRGSHLLRVVRSLAVRGLTMGIIAAVGGLGVVGAVRLRRDGTIVRLGIHLIALGGGSSGLGVVVSAATVVDDKHVGEAAVFAGAEEHDHEIHE